MKATITPYYFLIGILPAFTHAQDAGTLSRELEQSTPMVPATLDKPISTESTLKLSTDTTPILVQKIHLKDNTLLSNDVLDIIFAEYVGKETTFAGLQTLAQTLTHAYHQAGYPLVSVIIPPQRLEKGVVTLQVIEGKVNEISLNNHSRLTDDTVQGYLSAIPTGKTLNQKDSERALLLLKDLAGTKQVTYRLDGSQKGTTLVVDLESAPRFHGFAQVDNYGSKSTGELRTRVGLDINSPLGRGEKLSMQAMSSFKGVNYAKLATDIPIGYQGLTTSLGVGHTRYDLGGDFKDLDATGTATTFDASMRYPVLRNNQSNVWMSLGGEYRDLQDKIGSTNTVTDKSLKAIQLNINGFHQDNFLVGGYTQWSLINTLGRLSIDSADARALDAVSAKTQGNYHKINASINRTQYISPKFSLHASINGQWANKNLDSAEQLSLGGADAIAAYHSNDVSADMGVLGQLEARYALLPNLSVAAFYDAGRAKLRTNPYTPQDNFINLYGGGLGLYGQYKNLSLQSKMAWHDSSKKFSQDKNPRVWVKVGYGF